VTFRVTVPDDLTAVCNGQLTSEELLPENRKRFTWEVTYPINNYNVTLNIAKYAHFYDKYESNEGEILDLDYYVLEYNLEKAKKQFKQVEPTLSCFGEVFGEYPFWDDGFKLVETPYLGMEHQSAIAYGNFYMPGYLGRHPKGFPFDYIIIHETGHEWFGNSISCNDLSEMWIHESFTTYMEALYVECHQGYAKSIEYLNAFKPYIANKEPIIGPENVNWEDWEHGDHYYKGSWMLNTLRHTLDDESIWPDLLKGFYQKHKISNVVSQDFFSFVNEFTGKNYDLFFQQYLRYTKIPKFEYYLEKKGKSLNVQYRLISDVDLVMAVRFGDPEAYQKLEAGPEWQSITFKGLKEEDFEVATDLYLIKSKKVKWVD
ncbi:MAG: M1 family aminopeptidase, partial [Bacteroidota bacterium]